MAHNYPKWPKNDAWIYALFPQFFLNEKAVPHTFSLLECMEIHLSCLVLTTIKTGARLIKKTVLSYWSQNTWDSPAVVVVVVVVAVVVVVMVAVGAARTFKK